eukprot:4283121-Prymnesium_polylepis.1
MLSAKSAEPMAAQRLRPRPSTLPAMQKKRHAIASSQFMRPWKKPARITTYSNSRSRCSSSVAVSAVLQTTSLCLARSPPLRSIVPVTAAAYTTKISSANEIVSSRAQRPLPICIHEIGKSDRPSELRISGSTSKVLASAAPDTSAAGVAMLPVHSYAWIRVSSGWDAPPRSERTEETLEKGCLFGVRSCEVMRLLVDTREVGCRRGLVSTSAMNNAMNSAGGIAQPRSTSRAQPEQRTPVTCTFIRSSETPPCLV